MKRPRRQFLHLAAGAVALLVVADIAQAQTYPTRPVRLVAPFPPGGSIDITARLNGNGYRSGSASKSLSRTGRARPAISAARWR